MVVQTERLVVRKLTTEDAPFVLELLNDASFLRYIGDKNVRTLDDAREYIISVPIASYARHGFGHYLVELRATGEPIGICSLVRRDWLADVDLGFAFLPAFRRSGYAYEASAAVLAYAHATLGLKRIVAIVSPENGASIALLGRLGMSFERTVKATEDAAELQLFADVPGGVGV